jgi:Co/Zn/Cd efflux system component/predicted transcriptional regulator
MLESLRDIIREWKEDPYLKEHSDVSRFVLIALVKEGPLTLKELEEKSLLFISRFAFHRMHNESWDHKNAFDITKEIDNLMENDMIFLTGDTYELTEKGRNVAEKSAQMIERGAHWVNTNFLNPGAAARNTVVFDFFLAVMKLLVGFMSGSVGLLADGADAAVDTGSASVVWVGIRMKKELVGTLVIISLMGITGVSIGYESVVKITHVLSSTVEPMSRPYLVIGVEGIALVSAVFLCFYQGFIGKKFGSLALLSQSIDSKNHIYVAAAVIAGAVFSVVGIYFVDAVIGVYISFKILKDGFELSREVISSVKGEEIDFSKYEVLFEKHWRMSSHHSFQFWVLYVVRERSMEKDEIIAALERTFKRTYIPILSEFDFEFAPDETDFEERFDEIVQPLLEQGMLKPQDSLFGITRTGRQYVHTTLRGMRYHQIA